MGKKQDKVKIYNAKPGEAQFTSLRSALKMVARKRARFTADNDLEIIYRKCPRGEKPGRDSSAIQVGNSTRAAHGVRYRANHGPSLEEIHWRESVLKRDGYACVWCGSTEGLEADHIRPKSIYPQLRMDVGNGRTLCNPCHRKTPTYGGRVRLLLAYQETYSKETT